MTNHDAFAAQAFASMSPQPLDIAPQFAFDLPQYSPDPLLSALGLAMFVVFLVIVTYGARSEGRE